MVVSPLNVPAPGPMGPLRDLARENAGLRRDLEHARATALTAQAIPAPYVPPPDPPASPWGHRSVRLTGSPSVGNNTWTLLGWPALVEVSGTAVTAPTTADLRAGVTGLYHYAAHVHFVAGGVSAPREMRIMRNSSPIAYASETTAGAVTLHLSRPVRLAVGDVLAVEVRQESGGSLGIYNTIGEFNGWSLALIRAE